jgi:hypothetical protein
MSQQYQLVTELQSSVKLSPNALLTTFIGNKGGGKNTLSTLCVQIARQETPWVPCFANSHITGAHFVPDILKFLASKYIQKDFTPIEVDIDEAALAGLESRGSNTAKRALDSYLFTLARKVGANIRLLSQLLSMIEKRTQWISDYYVLCEASFKDNPFIPEKFVYTIYDTNLVRVNSFEVFGREAAQYLFPRFRTEEIPFQEQFARDLKPYYGVTDEDLAAFDEIMGIVRDKEPAHPKPKQIQLSNHRKFNDDEILRHDGSRWVIMDREYNVKTDDYDYQLEQLIE